MIALPCGHTRLTPSLPKEYDLITPGEGSGALTETQLKTRLLGAVPDGRRITILVPDGTRPLPVSTLLDWLQPALRGREVTIFIARGTHRAMTQGEVANHLGPLPSDWLVIQNEPDREDEYRSIGTTSRGTPVSFHRSVLDSDAILGLTLARPHYYAGYSGGRKIFLPGCSSRATIQANHRLVLHDDPSRGKNPDARLGHHVGNPVHEDMMEAMALLPIPHVVFHAIMAEGDIVEATIGGTDAYEDSLAILKRRLEVEVKQPYDTVIVSAGGHPRDLNFIQSHKAIENVIQALQPGGHLFLYASCPEGLGSEEMETFLGYGRIDLITRRLFEEFKIYGHTALSYLIKARDYHMHLHSDLPSSTLDLLKITPWDGVTLPDNPGRTALLPDATTLYLVRSRKP